MLPKANRVARADDFRMAVRRGRRVATPHALVYMVAKSSSDPTEALLFAIELMKSLVNSSELT